MYCIVSFCFKVLSSTIFRWQGLNADDQEMLRGTYNILQNVNEASSLQYNIYSEYFRSIDEQLEQLKSDLIINDGQKLTFVSEKEDIPMKLQLETLVKPGSGSVQQLRNWLDQRREGLLIAHTEEQFHELNIIESSNKNPKK